MVFIQIRIWVSCWSIKTQAIIYSQRLAVGLLFPSSFIERTLEKIFLSTYILLFKKSICAVSDISNYASP